MSSNVVMIPLHLIKTITDEFAEKNRLSKGGYGEVYKGVLNGEEIGVIKLFPVHGLDEEAFTNNEFRKLMKVQHKNIVRLIGYCYEITHQHIIHEGQFVFSKVIDQALCFEFMGQGSLSQHLSADSCIHDWPTTFKIIKGTCEAIDYLHRGRGENNSIYHLDLKPDNILMDKNMVPKIEVFGSSRLFNDSMTHQTTTAKGRTGFMPPEFTSNGIVTPKNDVFSLGVIIFHLMAGEKGYNDYCDLRLRRELLENREQFIGGVQEYWKKTMQKTVGYTLTGTDLLGVRACLQMAMRCVEDERDKRPSTREIISDLSKLNDQIEKMPTIVQTPTRSNRREKLDVVIVYAFDCTTASTPAWEKVGLVFSLVEKKLANFVDSRLGYVYVMSTPNTYKCDINFIDPSKKGESSATRSAVCTKNMAAGLTEAHKLIMCDNGELNGIILLFSDGLINKGDFFDGAEDFISIVPVHTFTLGGDAYNHGLRTIASNSPGGSFSPVLLTDMPSLSVPFLRKLDSLLDGTTRGHSNHPSAYSGNWPLDVVIVYAFDCTNSSLAWYTVGDVYAMVKGMLLANSESSIGFTYVTFTPNTCTSDMNLVSSTMTGYEKSAARSRTACVKNMACGLLEAHKLISYRGHWNSLILLFSDGLINKGDFFDGAEDYISRVPVHTFTLGGDAYNHGLRSMAANSPGGKFHNIQVPDKPILSQTFSQLLDSIIGDAMKTSYS
jgi:serine/threonine protein kinase